MTSNLNRLYRDVMADLEKTDPRAHGIIFSRVAKLKSEAADWRRKAQTAQAQRDLTSPNFNPDWLSTRGETPKKPLTDTHGEQPQRDLTPGTRVRDTGRPSRVGTIVNDPEIIDHPGMIPVVWDGGWRTFTAPETLAPIEVRGPITIADPFK